MRAELALLTLGLSGSMLGAASAQVVPASSVRPSQGPASNFSGKVTVRMLSKPMPPGQAGTALVSFAPGARSNWHTHPAGQTLHVTEGCGWTQEQGGAVSRICSGDTVYVRPGVRHWHGATATTAMTHLAITETRDGQNVHWLERVSNAEYHGPGR